jgi:hypothetical protein
MPDASRVDARRSLASAAGHAVALTAAGGFAVAGTPSGTRTPGTAADLPFARPPSTGLSLPARRGFPLGGPVLSAAGREPAAPARA